MKFYSLFLINILMLSSISSQVIDKNENPGSLWDDQAVDPCLDRIARREGDLITIILNEKSTGNFSAETNLSKSDTNLIQQILNIAKFDRWFPISNKSTSSNAGSGSTKQVGTLTATLTGSVKEVLPNGRFLISVCKDIMINREIQSFEIEGIIRVDDIASDNTIQSTSISDAKIKMFGSGAIYDRQRRGILTRIIDWLF